VSLQELKQVSSGLRAGRVDDQLPLLLFVPGLADDHVVLLNEMEQQVLLVHVLYPEDGQQGSFLLQRQLLEEAVA